MDTSDNDPFAPSTSNAHGSNSNTTSGHGGSRTFSASDIQTQGAPRQLSNLERAMAVTSPVIERANPLSMHVVSKPRRKHKTVADTTAGSSPTSVDRNGKGKAAANGEGAADSSSSEETALEPKEAIRQQFQVRQATGILAVVILLICAIDGHASLSTGVQCSSKDPQYLNT